MNTLIPLQIDPKILNIRGQRVLLDTDLSEIYGVVTNCDHLQRLKFSKSTPFAFTEHGAKSLSNITPCPLFTKDVYFGIHTTHEYHLHHRRV
jgi:hypothetical protein